jgi:hypothetical protein
VNGGLSRGPADLEVYQNERSVLMMSAGLVVLRYCRLTCKIRCPVAYRLALLAIKLKTQSSPWYAVPSIVFPSILATTGDIHTLISFPPHTSLTRIKTHLLYIAQPRCYPLPSPTTIFPATDITVRILSISTFEPIRQNLIYRSLTQIQLRQSL